MTKEQRAIKKAQETEAIKEVIQAFTADISERLDAIEEKRAIQKAKEEFEKSEHGQFEKAFSKHGKQSSALAKALRGL